MYLLVANLPFCCWVVSLCSGDVQFCQQEQWHFWEWLCRSVAIERLVGATHLERKMHTFVYSDVCWWSHCCNLTSFVEGSRLAAPGSFDQWRGDHSIEHAQQNTRLQVLKRGSIGAWVRALLDHQGAGSVNDVHRLIYSYFGYFELCSRIFVRNFQSLHLLLTVWLFRALNMHILLRHGHLRLLSFYELIDKPFICQAL